jgi:hypothetical protein
MMCLNPLPAPTKENPAGRNSRGAVGAWHMGQHTHREEASNKTNQSELSKRLVRRISPSLDPWSPYCHLNPPPLKPITPSQSPSLG